MNEKFQQMLDLDQKIAEARARVEMEKSLPERGMLSPGIFDYITEGKNDLYKGYYDAVRAREMQDAQMANQRLMQERQLENALRLAQESRAAQQDKINSDNEKSYQLAKNRLDIAKALHEKAVAEGDLVGILNAEDALNKATIEYNDTLRLTGRQPEPMPEATQEVPEENNGPVAKGVRIADLKSITGFKTEKEKNKTLRAIQNDPLYNQDPNLRSEYNRLNKIRSAEDRENRRLELEKKGSAATKAELDAEGLVWQVKTDKNGKKTRQLVYKTK